MFWHTSEHEIYLNKNKFTEVIRKRKISYPDNYAFWQTSESQKYLIKNIYTKGTREEVKNYSYLITWCFDTLLNMKYTWIKINLTEVIRKRKRSYPDN